MENIAIFKESILGASERFVLDQAIHIRGYKVTLIGMKKLPFINLAGVTHKTIDQVTKWQIVAYKLLGICPALKRLIRGINPKLIHIHMGGDGARFSRLKGIRVPFIVTFHGTDASTSDSWKRNSKNLYLKQYLRYRENLINTASHFIAISYFVKKCMVNQGYPKEKITVHYMGIDTKFFTPKKCIRKKYVLFVGRLIEVKGCSYLIHAMAKVQQYLPEAELIVIGDGDDRKGLQDISTRLNVKTSFLGVLDRVQIKEYLNEVSVFCVPSIMAKTGGSEGLGIVFLEAQSMGTPVVSTLSGGISEAVKNGETGLLYPVKDIQGLAYGIFTLLTDDLLWDKMSVSAMKHVRETFDIEKQTIKLESIYSKIIEKNL